MRRGLRHVISECENYQLYTKQAGLYVQKNVFQSYSTFEYETVCLMCTLMSAKSLFDNSYFTYYKVLQPKLELRKFVWVLIYSACPVSSTSDKNASSSPIRMHVPNEVG